MGVPAWIESPRRAGPATSRFWSGPAPSVAVPRGGHRPPVSVIANGIGERCPPPGLREMRPSGGRSAPPPGGSGVPRVLELGRRSRAMQPRPALLDRDFRWIDVMGGGGHTSSRSEGARSGSTAMRLDRPGLLDGRGGLGGLGLLGLGGEVVEDAGRSWPGGGGSRSRPARRTSGAGGSGWPRSGGAADLGRRPRGRGRPRPSTGRTRRRRRPRPRRSRRASTSRRATSDRGLGTRRPRPGGQPPRRARRPSARRGSPGGRRPAASGRRVHVPWFRIARPWRVTPIGRSASRTPGGSAGARGDDRGRSAGEQAAERPRPRRGGRRPRILGPDRGRRRGPGARSARSALDPVGQHGDLVHQPGVIACSAASARGATIRARDADGLSSGTRTISEQSPCFRAFIRDRSLPSWVFGPVRLWAFRRWPRVGRR